MLCSVGAEPVVGEPLSDQTVVAPDTASFTCRISSGEPRADVLWYRGTKVLTPGDKYIMTYEDDVASLQILNSEPADATAYRVEARNKVGEVKSEATLKVHGEITSTFLT